MLLPQRHPDQSPGLVNISNRSRTHQQRPPALGTREDVEAEDYESPLSNMFGRAYDGYRIAENTRRHDENAMPNPLRRMGNITDNVENQRFSHHGVPPDFPRRLVHEARESIAETQHDFTASTRALTIDTQERPAPTAAAEMVINIACPICTDHPIDVILFPCGHACMCKFCAEICVPTRPNLPYALPPEPRGYKGRCPKCRRDVKEVRPFFLG
jgi:hypothetical protein